MFQACAAACAATWMLIAASGAVEASSSRLNALRAKHAGLLPTGEAPGAPAPAAAPEGPAETAREFRAAEGAIVNIIDSYLERKAPAKLKHVFAGTVKVTYYWTADELDHSSSRQVAITVLRPDGRRVTEQVSQKFRHHLDLEGTAMLANGMVLNVTSRKGVYQDVTRDAVLGMGTHGNGLVPFRSIAVNRSRGVGGLRVGDRVFIPDAVGIPLPTGIVHDGYFRVDDVGSGVKGIDIYTMTREQSIVLAEALRNDQRKVPIYKVLPGGSQVAQID